ncbi:MAG TPA: TIGR03086 family metal-binding protein [Sporichthyaceae bacterium]|nr:TIGR03086 family metal-binding protein [Sporichthyaceae bacterium]
MSETLARYRKLADDLTARVEAVPPGAWNNQSPCDEWTALDVMDHVIGNARASVNRLDGVEHEERKVTDAPAEWAAARAGVEAALADPTRAGTVIDGPMGPMPFEVLVGRFQCMDMLIHTWDLARATGGDENVDARAAAGALEGLKPLGDVLRSPGVFGPAIEPPPGADPVTELMCFVGRKV